MKIFLLIIGIVAAGILGYSFEPQMRYSLTGKTDEWKKPEEAVRRVTIQSDAPKKTIDPSSWPADQLPEKVELKGDAEIANETGDIKMTITAGNRVDLVRLEGQMVVISPGPGPFQGTVPIIQTDLLDQLATLEIKPPALNPVPDPVDPTAIASTTPEETDVPAPDQEVAVIEPEVPTTTDTSEGDVESVPAEPEIAANDPEEVDSPAEEEPPAVVEPEPSGGSVNVVGVMQSSIKAGDIKEFTFDQVLDWKANDEPETIEGESYQTGLASYKAETVFGVKTIQAKALIKDGKVVRWLWPKSGMEIK